MFHPDHCQSLSFGQELLLTTSNPNTSTMKKREPVSHIMTKDLVTVNVHTPLKEAHDLFTKHKVRHLPVVSGDELIGILSYTDIMRISFGGNFDQDHADEAIFDMLSINQVMKSHVKTISPEDNIKDVAEIFTHVEFHALPVTENEKLVGIVTTTDLIQYLVDLY